MEPVLQLLVIGILVGILLWQFKSNPERSIRKFVVVVIVLGLFTLLTMFD